MGPSSSSPRAQMLSCFRCCAAPRMLQPWSRPHRTTCATSPTRHVPFLAIGPRFCPLHLLAAECVGATSLGLPHGCLDLSKQKESHDMTGACSSRGSCLPGCAFELVPLQTRQPSSTDSECNPLRHQSSHVCVLQPTGNHLVLLHMAIKLL